MTLVLLYLYSLRIKNILKKFISARIMLTVRISIEYMDLKIRSNMSSKLAK